jgi:tetratricopeptide (TPR) repeat protein
MRIPAPSLKMRFKANAGVILIALCIHGLVFARNDSMHGLSILDQAKALYRAGSFQMAETLLRSAISEIPEPGAIDLVQLWNELGQVHESEGRLSDAERDYQQAIRRNEGLKDSSLIDLAVSLNNLGTLAEARHQFPAAGLLFRRSLTALTKGTLLSSPITGAVLTNLAMSMQKQGQYAEAGRLYDLGIPELRTSYGENSTEYIKALSSFGLFKFETGRYLDALELQRKICRTQRLLSFVSNADQALALNNLGLTLLELGSLAEAESHLREAISLERRSSPPDPEIVESLNNLAVLEQRVGRFEEAKKDESEALRIVLNEFPTGDPMIATVWNNMGKLAAAQRRFREASQFYRRAEAAWLRNGRANTGYSATLSNRAGLEAKQRHHKQARELYEQALQIDKAAFGSDHPRVATDLSNLAVESFVEKRHEESVRLFLQAEQIQEVAFGWENIQVARTLRNLAVAQRASKQLSEAEQSYRRAIDIGRNSAKDSPELMSWLYEYAELLKREQRFGEAEQAEVQASGILVRNAITASKQDGRSGALSAFK